MIKNLFVALALGFALSLAPVASASAAAVLDHTAEMTGSTVSVQVTASIDVAGQSVSVVILSADSSMAAPDRDDIVYLSEMLLDDAGSLVFDAVLPVPPMDDYVLSLSTSGADRYLALLGSGIAVDPGDEDGDGNPGGDGGDGGSQGGDGGDGGSTGGDSGSAGGSDDATGSDNVLGATGSSIAWWVIGTGFALTVVGVVMVRLRSKRSL